MCSLPYYRHNNQPAKPSRALQHVSAPPPRQTVLFFFFSFVALSINEKKQQHVSAPPPRQSVLFFVIFIFEK